MVRSGSGGARTYATGRTGPTGLRPVPLFGHRPGRGRHVRFRRGPDPVIPARCPPARPSGLPDSPVSPACRPPRLSVSPASPICRRPATPGADPTRRSTPGFSPGFSPRSSPRSAPVQGWLPGRLERAWCSGGRSQGPEPARVAHGLRPIGSSSAGVLAGRGGFQARRSSVASARRRAWRATRLARGVRLDLARGVRLRPRAGRSTSPGPVPDPASPVWYRRRRRFGPAGSGSAPAGPLSEGERPDPRRGPPRSVTDRKAQPGRPRPGSGLAARPARLGLARLGLARQRPGPAKAPGPARPSRRPASARPGLSKSPPSQNLAQQSPTRRRPPGGSSALQEARPGGGHLREASSSRKPGSVVAGAVVAGAVWSAVGGRAAAVGAPAVRSLRFGGTGSAFGVPLGSRPGSAGRPGRVPGGRRGGLEEIGADPSLGGYARQG